jgi:hypothetical protein
VTPGSAPLAVVNALELVGHQRMIVDRHRATDSAPAPGATWRMMPVRAVVRKRAVVRSVAHRRGAPDHRRLGGLRMCDARGGWGLVNGHAAAPPGFEPFRGPDRHPKSRGLGFRPSWLAILMTFIRNGPWFPRLVTFLGYQGSKLAEPFFPVSRESSLSRFPDRNGSHTIATADIA